MNDPRQEQPQEPDELDIDPETVKDLELNEDAAVYGGIDSPRTAQLCAHPTQVGASCPGLGPTQGCPSAGCH